MKYLPAFLFVLIGFGIASAAGKINLKGLKNLFSKVGDNLAESGPAMIGTSIRNMNLNHYYENESDEEAHKQNKTRENAERLINTFKEMIGDIRKFYYSQNETLGELPGALKHLKSFFPAILNFYGNSVKLEINEYLPEIMFPLIEKTANKSVDHFCYQENGISFLVNKDDTSLGLLIFPIAKHQKNLQIFWCPMDLTLRNLKN